MCGLLKTRSRVTNNHTKFLSCLRLLVLLTLWQAGDIFEARAQNFSLTVRTSPTNAVQVGSTVTYTIGVSNFSSFDVSAVIVSNTLSASVKLTGRTTTQGTVVTNGSSLVFFVGLVPQGSSAVMTVTGIPTVAGFFTNQVLCFAPSLQTNVLTTTVFSQATNPVVVSDLAVMLGTPAAPVFTGDWISYRTGVTNLGPNTAPNVVLTNTLPVGTKLLSVSPASQTFQLVSNQLTFPITSLASNAFTNFVLRVQLPTNAGAALFTASAGATGATDLNPANNTATNSVNIAGYFPVTLLAVTNAAQYTNRQNGLIEQKILVSNVGTASVDSVRVILTGLTNVPLAGYTNYLFNATGTNAGNPFVTYAATLNPGEGVELRLQFYVRTRSTFPFGNSQLHAVGVSQPDLTPPPAVGTSTNFHFSRNARLSTGEHFLEVSNTIAGQVYTIVYSDDSLFSNARMALPPIVAPANFFQWLDYGPPATVSKPGSNPRFYKVFLNP